MDSDINITEDLERIKDIENNSLEIPALDKTSVEVKDVEIKEDETLKKEPDTEQRVKDEEASEAQKKFIEEVGEIPGWTEKDNKLMVLVMNRNKSMTSEV